MEILVPQASAPPSPPPADSKTFIIKNKSIHAPYPNKPQTMAGPNAWDDDWETAADVSLPTISEFMKI